MAPRKSGNRRIDAALDAMSPYGFPEKNVCQKVKELLNVYGGNSGWVFIEDASYKELIEALLREQQQEAIDCAQQHKEGGEANISPFPAMPLIKSTTSNQMILGSSSQAGGEGAGPSNEHIQVLADEVVDPTMSQANDSARKDWKDINLDENCGKKQTENIIVNNCPAPNDFEDGEIGETITVSCSSVIVSPQSMCSSFPPTRSKSCHGWICDDGEEEDFVDLKPAPLSDKCTKLLSLAQGLKKRRRWDVK